MVALNRQRLTIVTLLQIGSSSLISRDAMWRQFIEVPRLSLRHVTAMPDVVHGTTNTSVAV